MGEKKPTNNFDRAIEVMKEQLCNLIDSHKADIKSAFDELEELKGVTIGLAGRLSPANEQTNDIDVKTRIAFSLSKVTDSLEETVTNQQALPGMEKQPADKQAKSSAEVLGVKTVEQLVTE